MPPTRQDRISNPYWQDTQDPFEDDSKFNLDKFIEGTENFRWLITLDLILMHINFISIFLLVIVRIIEIHANYIDIIKVTKVDPNPN